jgi:hypothetical protein
MEMSGFLIPAASKISISASDSTALSIICLIAFSIASSYLPLLTPVNFASLAFTA